MRRSTVLVFMARKIPPNPRIAAMGKKPTYADSGTKPTSGTKDAGECRDVGDPIEPFFC